MLEFPLVLANLWWLECSSNYALWCNRVKTSSDLANGNQISHTCSTVLRIPMSMASCGCHSSLGFVFECLMRNICYKILLFSLCEKCMMSNNKLWNVNGTIIPVTRWMSALELPPMRRRPWVITLSSSPVMILAKPARNYALELEEKISTGSQKYKMCFNYKPCFWAAQEHGIFGQQFDPLVFVNFSKFTTKRVKMTVKE